MKISIELSDSEVKEICRVTGEKKKGTAIRKLVQDALILKRRASMTENFISGKWGVELAGFEAAQAVEKRKSEAQAKAWRK